MFSKSVNCSSTNVLPATSRVFLRGGN